MIESYVIGILGIVGLMTGWVLIQQVWKKTFAEYSDNEDALADRSKCGNCHCTSTCELKNRKLKGNI